MKSVTLAFSVLLLAPALAALAPIATPARAASVTAPFPIAVIAHIDAGVNPYNVEFRDDGPLAYVHPSHYIAGYPASAQAVRLSLNESDYNVAIAKDATVLASLQKNKLYWFPGTRIVGDISLGNGGTNCPLIPIPPASVVAVTPPGTTPCAERTLLDDHGHGTMTASRMAGTDTSLCPSCRIVSIEGLGAASVKWAADQGWIDVQTNSWVSLVPDAAIERPPGVPSFIGGQVFGGTSTASTFEEAAKRMMVFAASGNGAAYVTGFAPTPTYGMATAAPGVILVGGHDNGYVTPWSGAPAHVTADAFGGLRAARDSMSAWGPDPISCCTSAASPYAAGGMAAEILYARQLLGDTGTGLRGDAIAMGAPVPGSAFLDDGKLTLYEARMLLFHTATARPVAGPHDGLLHWTATGNPAGQEGYITTFGPGANPFCQGCVTSPVQWKDVPADAFAYPQEGYGAIDPVSVAFAQDVLAGSASALERPMEDAAYAADQTLRATHT